MVACSSSLRPPLYSLLRHQQLLIRLSSTTARPSKIREPRIPFPTTPTCPPSTCPCAPMPSGLDIDHKLPLSGTSPKYDQHIVISTGKADWTLKIEDEAAPNLAKELKSLLGIKGRFHNPHRNVLITNTSFPKKSPNETDVRLFPSGILVPAVPNSASGAEQIITSHLLPLLQQTKSSSLLTTARHILAAPTKTTDAITILICSHNARDTRCGILGPLLYDEFVKRISPEKVELAMTSHLTGHRFAGNLIIYFPHSYTKNGEKNISSLAGKGVWYGRVEPRHVEGIVRRTVEGGEVIEELCRGWV
jgi:hypothetical protein